MLLLLVLPGPPKFSFDRRELLQVVQVDKPVASEFDSFQLSSPEHLGAPIRSAAEQACGTRDRNI